VHAASTAGSVAPHTIAHASNGRRYCRSNINACVATTPRGPRPRCCFALTTTSSR
jgi:hypothetical protein